jgi:hypothetical protein
MTIISFGRFETTALLLSMTGAPSNSASSASAGMPSGSRPIVDVVMTGFFAASSSFTAAQERTERRAGRVCDDHLRICGFDARDLRGNVEVGYVEMLLLHMTTPSLFSVAARAFANSMSASWPDASVELMIAIRFYPRAWK